MVRVDWLDAIDAFLRNNRNSPLPFGGVQMIFFGDLFQLPPVVGSNEEAAFIQKYYQSCPYFFGARVFHRLPLQMIELHEVYRQADLRFIRLLDAIRTQTLDYDDLEAINYRYQPEELENDMSYRVVLSARNATVNYINKQELDKLSTAAYAYVADITGNVNPSALPASTPLNLKIGAQVMFLKNDQKGRYVNGTIGRVSYLGVDSIEVSIPDSKGYLQKIDVEKHEWEIMQHTLENSAQLSTKVIGTFKQYPLRLAWAMTIHKSQGQTFEKVLIDLDKGAFEFGQTYVALSRCKSLEGILLKKPLLPKDVFVDGRVVDFYQNHR